MFSPFKNVVAAFAVVALLASCEDGAKKKAEMAAKMAADSIRMADSTAKVMAEAEAAKPKDIVTIASSGAKTLAAAVTAAGLVETLQGAGPFTVFAPSDEAFAAIQKDVDNLLKPENKAKLTKVLTYHVVSGKMMAADLKDGQELTTVEGAKLKVSIKDGKVMVGGANVTGADVAASNGVIHMIDKVLLPKM
jgi:uncharacterized surface protein with fasciclin (FAS1) repeats